MSPMNHATARRQPAWKTTKSAQHVCDPIVASDINDRSSEPAPKKTPLLVPYLAEATIEVHD